MSDMAEPSAAAKTDERKNIGFDDMQLPVGIRLQLLLGTPAQQYVTRLIGYASGEYLIMHIPVVNGLSIPISEGAAVTVRVLAGVSVFTFKTHVVRALRNDLHLLLLAYPERVQATTFRAAPRVKVQLQAEATPRAGSAPGAAVSVTVVDISATGAKLKTESDLGGKDDEIELAFGFRLQFGDEEMSLKLPSRIRSVSDKTAAGNYVYGLEFTALEGNDKLYLQSFVYERMLEDRQAVV